MPLSLKSLSLAITILGILFLLYMINFQQPLKVANPEQLSSLEENTKVQAEGIVTKESSFTQTKLLKLSSGIEVITDLSSPALLNKSISVIGTISKYLNKTQIEALKITPIENSD